MNTARRFSVSPRVRLWIFLAAGLIFFSGWQCCRAQQAATNGFGAGPVPAWVKVQQPPGETTNAAPETEGELYLLLDSQENAATQQSYWHVVKQITSQNGVQNGARLQFQFDPTFQQISVHFIRIIRDGKILDRLEPDKFKIIQQETGLERQMFNGTLSAVLFLEDVRVGDTIEYACTTKGANPILGGRFVSDFSVEWYASVRQEYIRLLWPPDRNLTIKNHQTTVQPSIRELEGFKEYTWELEDVPAVTAEDQVPSWYETYGWVQLTEFSSWRQVEEWARPLYDAGQAELPADLNSKIAGWQFLRKPEDRVQAALRFVQDEVRYLGIEIGPKSHQPNPPGVVFNHRFGDCKDKVNLFCAILRRLGVEAHPALTHTYNRQMIESWAPSPFAFNHVIAQVKIEGRTYWLDPTRSYQRGPLSEMWIPNYACSLVVARDSTDLTKVPECKAGLPFTTIDQAFRITNYNSPVALDITTIKRGADADYMRARLAETRREELEKSYLNHYAKSYPKIKSARPIEISDDEDNNIITVSEHYRLSDIWELSDDKSKWSLDFYPEDIHDLVGKPETSLRAQPLWVNYPLKQRQTTRIFLPGDGAFTNETTTFQDKAVRFERQVTYSGRVLAINYDYEALANFVPVPDVPEHLKILKRIRDTAVYVIQHPNEPPHRTRGPQFNWTLFVLAVTYSLVMTGAAVLVYRFRPGKPPAAEIAQSNLTGLGGWLGLLGFGLIFRPLMWVRVVLQSAPVYGVDNWNQLTSPGGVRYNANWAPLLLFELLGNLTFLVFSGLLLVLFFQKRFAFPRVFIGCLLANICFLLVDWALVQMIASLHKTADRAASQFIPMVIFSFVWILYLHKSKRVQQTFVE